jgi:hypothetical protein
MLYFFLPKFLFSTQTFPVLPFNLKILISFYLKFVTERRKRGFPRWWLEGGSRKHAS